ncbi:hypothetical protein BsWGS_22895 [Bradybaena similaris]
MLLAVAGPARGRSHTSRTGNDPSDIYGYFDRSHYYAAGNGTGSAFGSVFDECDSTDYGEEDLAFVHYVPLVLYPFLLLQGIVGNMLAIPALVSVSRTAWSTVFYLACLGGTDLMLLLIRCGDAWYQELVKVSLSQRILDSSDAACKTYYFIFMCIKHTSPWLMVAISVEMMIATRWPKRTYFMCTLERARNVVMLIGVIIVCLDINHFWTYGVPKPGFACVPIEEFSEHFKDWKDWAWPAMDNTVELVLPVIIVTICFFLTAISMMRSPVNQRRDLEVEMKNYFLELSTLRDFSTVCFILCLLFIFLNTCRIVYTLTTLVSMVGEIEMDCPILRGIKTIDVTLNFFFYSAKIYLYLAFSSMFRANLRQGFINARRKFQRLCRIVCLCGYKWAPVPPKDKSDDAKLAPGQSKSANTDLVHTRKPNDPAHGIIDAHTAAPGGKESHKSALSHKDPAEARDTSMGLKHSHVTEVPEFVRADSKRRLKGASNDVNATNV